MSNDTDSGFDKGGIAVIYTSQPPFVYGSITYMKSDDVQDGLVKPRWSTPFLFSRTIDGTTLIYGGTTVLLDSLMHELNRIIEFQKRTNAMLTAKNVRRTTVGRTTTINVEPLGQQIVNEQDQVYEKTLIVVATYFRRLVDQFRNKANRRYLAVYDYDNKPTGRRISLSRISDLLLHARYYAIRNAELYDLFSDQQGFISRSDLGFKIKLAEYVTEVVDFVCNLTVSDLVGRLRGVMESLSISSDIADVIFLYQNLYQLGDSIISPTVSINQGFVATILNSVAASEIKKKWPSGVPSDGIVQTAKFTSPRFYPRIDNLNKKAVRVTMVVNGKPEELILDYCSFFDQLTQNFGSRPLYTSPTKSP